VKIYLDFNSTHPPNQIVLSAARQFYFDHFANSSGLSLASQQVNSRIEEARIEIARLTHVTPAQIIFTSCATESNNLLIRHFFSESPSRPYRIHSSPFEHPSISETLKLLTQTEVEYAASEGQYDLACCMAVQNESGVMLNGLDVGFTAVSKICDFSQALPKLAADAPPQLQPQVVRRLTDAGWCLTATGHKLGAGYGAGLIIAPPNAMKNAHLLAGGNQEHQVRAGSHNLEAILAFAGALGHKIETNRYELWQQLTLKFEKMLLDRIASAIIIGANLPRAPGTTLLLLRGVPIDFLIMGLDREGITVSTGTSCKSRSRTPSAAVMAMGYSEADALSVVRLSYDQNLREEEMIFVVEKLAALVGRLAP